VGKGGIGEKRTFNGTYLYFHKHLETYG
jgi:hypothetical protein